MKMARHSCAALIAGLCACLPLQARAQIFNDIVWYQIESYCSFMRAGHEFVFDDPNSWRWVAFSNFPAEGQEPLDRLFLKVNGNLREFNLAEARETDGVPQRIYKTSGDPEITVQMDLYPGEESYESTAYEGVLIEPVSGETIEFSGDCGV